MKYSAIFSILNIEYSILKKKLKLLLSMSWASNIDIKMVAAFFEVSKN